MRGNGNAQCQCGVPGTHLSVDRRRGAVPSFVARQPRSLDASLRGNAEMRSRSSTLHIAEYGVAGLQCGAENSSSPSTSYIVHILLAARPPQAMRHSAIPHAPCPMPSTLSLSTLSPAPLPAGRSMPHVPCPMSHVPCPCRVLAASTLHLVPSLVFSVQAFRPYHAVSGLSAPLQSNQYNLGVRRPGGEGLIIHAQVVYALQACGMQ